MNNLQFKGNLMLLLKSIAVPLLTGALASILTIQSMQNFSTLNKPVFSPPAILFPIVWTILYTLMGIGSYIVVTSGGSESDIQRAIRIYRLQLLVNFLWPTFFFNFQWYLFSFLWLIFLWILVFVMIIRFERVSKIAAYINIFYLIWLTYAAALNLSIFMLN